ncbi:MAG: hypothetical protein L0207_01290 [Chlamydiae bacterium]|nr:hypothetical protein [Chlamydiota bacterium]
MDEEKSLLNEIFSQGFSHLASGSQCYVFISEDKKSVLKFFRMKHFLPKSWLKFFPLPGLEMYRFNKIDRRKQRQIDLFSSYKMAFDTLRRETGLIYIHLNKTNEWNRKITLIDKKKKKHLLDVDQYEFVVQKKCELFLNRLKRALENKNEELATKTIRSLLEQIIEKCKKGFADKDHGINHNYGFIGEEIVHLDVGRMFFDEEVKKPSYYQKEISRVGKKLRNWIAKEYPEFMPKFEKEITLFCFQ